jgi:hypothetical protein
MFTGICNTDLRTHTQRARSHKTFMPNEGDLRGDLSSDDRVQVSV